MSNDSPKQESSFEKGFGFAAGLSMFLFCCLIGALIGIMLAERFGPPNMWSRSRSAAAIGTPGGGYVAGAPRNAQECAQRGGTVVYNGRGCENYR